MGMPDTLTPVYWTADMARRLPEDGLHDEILQVRVELLRWMFGFWVSTLIGIAGLAIALR
jgi:hypothetical protein